ESGPNTASSASATSTTAAPTAAGLSRSRRTPERALMAPKPRACTSLMPHPWIEPAVNEIGGEIEEERQRAIENDHRHDERVVAIERALDQVAAGSRKRKHRLHHQRSREDVSGRGSEIAHDGQQSRTQCVPQEDTPGAETSRPRSVHEACAQRLEQTAAHHAGDRGADR